MNQQICPPIECVQATICKTTEQHIIGTAIQLTDINCWIEKGEALKPCLILYTCWFLVICLLIYAHLNCFQADHCLLVPPFFTQHFGSQFQLSRYLVLTTYFLRYYGKWIVVTKHTMLMICFLWFHFALSRQISVASCYYMSYWFINVYDIWNFLNFVMTNGPAYM